MTAKGSTLLRNANSYYNSFICVCMNMLSQNFKTLKYLRPVTLTIILWFPSFTLCIFNYLTV